jgi:hypothetical protein
MPVTPETFRRPALTTAWRNAAPKSLTLVPARPGERG